MSSDDADFDVLVVGYGPVGATLGCLLGQFGRRVLVVDRAENICPHPRAISLDHEALRILQLAGLPSGSFPTRPIERVRLHCPSLGSSLSSTPADHKWTPQASHLPSAQP